MFVYAHTLTTGRPSHSVTLTKTRADPYGKEKSPERSISIRPTLSTRMPSICSRTAFASGFGASDSGVSGVSGDGPSADGLLAGGVSADGLSAGGVSTDGLSADGVSAGRVCPGASAGPGCS